MATPLVLLLKQAVDVGVTVARRRDGTLAITTTKTADAIARAIRARDAEVLALYDWRRARVDEPAPCVLCGRPALLRDPANSRPCHKVCTDQLLYARTTSPPSSPDDGPPGEGGG